MIHVFMVNLCGICKMFGTLSIHLAKQSGILKHFSNTRIKKINMFRFALSPIHKKESIINETGLSKEELKMAAKI